MAVFKPFKAIRPRSEHVKAVASRPYDVLNSEEARIESSGNNLSFLHVVKPEIDLPKDTDPYSNEVYEKGKENLVSLRSSGVLIQDDNASYYIYRLTMEGRSQIGLVGCCFLKSILKVLLKNMSLLVLQKKMIE